MTEWRWPGAAVFERYAAAVGKDAAELTQAERGLAVANWALEMTEGEMSREEVTAYFAERDNSPEARRGDELWLKLCAANTRIVELEAALVKRDALIGDLLAACEAIVAYTTRGDGAGWRVTEMAEAAIRKARGGE